MQLATCEGLKKEQYKQITQLTISTNNLAYYCSLNQCASLKKKLIHDHLSSLKNNADTPTLRSVQAEQENLHRIISEVSGKIDSVSDLLSTGTYYRPVSIRILYP